MRPRRRQIYIQQRRAHRGSIERRPLPRVSAGAAALILTGNNTYTGGTTVSAGILQLGNGGTTGSLGGNITNNAALVFDHSNSITFPGSISGFGSLIQAGNGELILSGTDTYSGGTTIDAGTLVFTSKSVLLDGSSLTVGAGGTLIFDPSAAAAPVTGATFAASTVSPVPEPGTLGLLATAVCGAVVYRRIRSRSTKNSCHMQWGACASAFAAGFSGLGSVATAVVVRGMRLGLLINSIVSWGSRKTTHFSEWGRVGLRASVTPTNGTSLSVEPGFRIQPIAIGYRLSYHPL